MSRERERYSKYSGFLTLYIVRENQEKRGRNKWNKD